MSELRSNEERVDVEALRRLEVRAGLHWNLDNAHPLLMAFGPLLAEVTRLRTENVAVEWEHHRRGNLLLSVVRERDAARTEVSQLRAKIEKVCDVAVTGIEAQQTAYLPDGPDHCEVAANIAYRESASIARAAFSALLAEPSGTPVSDKPATTE